MINTNAPFPQANDFNKVIKILNTGHEDNLKDSKYLNRLFGDISSRQISYYFSACDYLGVIQNRKFTPYGLKLRELNKDKQIELLRDDLCGIPVFRYAIDYYSKNANEIDMLKLLTIMKETVMFNSEAVYIRRLSTVVAWAKWFAKRK